MFPRPKMERTTKIKWKNVGIAGDIFQMFTKLVGHHGYKSVADIVMICIRPKLPLFQRQLEEIEKKKAETGREFS